MAVCAAVIGKDNSPKFFATINPDDELQFQYKVLSSLDVIEEKLNSGSKGGTDLKELYLGLLLSLETHKIFGYVTNTKIKLLIVVDSTNMILRDNEIRSMFRKIHSEYADIVSNPFYIPGEPICSKSMGYISNRSEYWLHRIGTREMVGFGMNGQPSYVDNANFPFPAIRYKELTSDIQALNDKQKGNWKLLSCNEKKALYRASFCQTFAEFTAPSSGDWMGIVGIGLILASCGLWIYIFELLFVDDPLPVTFKPSRLRAQLRRRIDMEEDPITGLASNWDYDKMDWKKVKWWTPPNPFVKCLDDE